MPRKLDIQRDEHTALKQVLSELDKEGKLGRKSRRRIAPTSQPLTVGHVLVVEIVSIEEDSRILATPLNWGTEMPAPQIEILPTRRIKSPGHKTTHTLDIGIHVLVRLRSCADNTWYAETLKKLGKGAKVHLGILTKGKKGECLSPCHRKDRFPEVWLTPLESKNFCEGDILAFSLSPTDGVKIHEKIGPIHDPKTFSQMAIYTYQLPHIFSPEAIALSQQGKVPELGERTDLRHIPLVTIDGEDARDFDDAVWASADNDPHNLGGWKIIVAIADVAYYVRPKDALDQAARERGNSVYFPGRVIPMLPEALSNNLCSLKPHEDRACLAVEMVISQNGKVKSSHIIRALMRSQARLTYAQVQQAIDGFPDATTAPLLKNVIKPLYGAYQSLAKARKSRGALELNQPERQVVFGCDGHIERVVPRLQYDSHRLIEEFMIAANVEAARTLKAKGWPCLYRIHDAPDALRVANLRQLLGKIKVPFTKTVKPQPSHFNALLTKTRQTPIAQLVSDLVLRSQSQACYSPLNIGHFGLSLSQYAHFTSPIRRYADLIVHRSLIAALHLGPDGFSDKATPLTTVANHISATERQATLAEREVTDRFITAYHAPHVGEAFPATIVGLTKAGLFVAITNTGAQGFVPRSSLNDTFHYDMGSHRFIGRHTKAIYQLGDHLTVLLQEANVITNSLIFEIVEETPQQKIPNKKKKKKPSRSSKKGKGAKRKS